MENRQYQKYSIGIRIKMKSIQSIKLNAKLLYDNRHLYTDNCQYNSLILSNIFNKPIKLLDMNLYRKVKYQLDTKHEIIDLYIFDKEGLYRKYGMESFDLIKWDILPQITNIFKSYMTCLDDFVNVLTIIKNIK